MREAAPGAFSLGWDQNEFDYQLQTVSLTAYCLLPSAFCLLPSAYCLLPQAGTKMSS